METQPFPHLLDQVCYVEGTQGGLLSHFHHDHVPGSQGRPQFPSLHQQREVPLEKKKKSAELAGSNYQARNERALFKSAGAAPTEAASEPSRAAVFGSFSSTVFCLPGKTVLTCEASQYHCETTAFLELIFTLHLAFSFFLRNTLKETLCNDRAALADW